ncbi:NrdH-redoxin [Patescibacteria group bacterium AH-259-L05]|nr:NrdH-redoxin [Patescibacteria group bacterium AH-259-L05]
MNVTIYTTPMCPYCHQEKEFFKANNIEFNDIDVSKDQEAARTMIEKTGQMGVPVTEIDGEFIVGFDEPRLREKLNIQ